MSDSKHTPGPWRIGQLESYDAYTGKPFRNVWAGDGEAALTIARAIDNGDVDANARLISAAPDLLEAAEAVLAADAAYMASDAQYPDEVIWFVRTLLGAAVAKAKGEVSQ